MFGPRGPKMGEQFQNRIEQFGGAFVFLSMIAVIVGILTRQTLLTMLAALLFVLTLALYIDVRYAILYE